MKRIEFLLYTGALLAPIKVLPKLKKRTLKGDWENLTDGQKKIRDFSYESGIKYGFEKTLTAIAWQESSFGQILRSKKEASSGTYGGFAVTVARRHFELYLDDKKVGDRIIYALPNSNQLEYVGNRLVLDYEFAAEHALLQLREGEYRSITNSIRLGGPPARSWQYIWAYYNGGTNCMEEPLALRYAADIYKKVKIIRQSGYNG